MKGNNETQNKIIIYTDKHGNVEFKADVEKETIWATQTQIAEIFDIDRTVATKHINSILKDEEVSQKSNVQKMHIPNSCSDKPTSLYSLDIILAVGYRTNSKKAIQFRQWATKTLRQYIIDGIAVNIDRIKQLPDKILNDLDEKIKFIQQTVQKRELNREEVDGLLSVIKSYAHSWQLLKKYDEGELKLQRSKNKERERFSYEFVRPAIDQLKTSLMEKEEATDIFGNERDESFKGILGNIYQTFGGKELYASLEEKAAHLLYFTIKDHPFSDGNKRIGSFLFVYFLDENKLLYRPDGEKKINDNTLVAMALLIAESDPKDKEVMVVLVTNLLV
ncbi:MAG: virulence protein RhuM/Fic/DOC family protein [bacterium]|nr:virulence protein RhuM/Fic/DOC family protein [bacterium]